MLGAGCASDPYEPYMLHEPSSWRVTPGGVVVDNSNFRSVREGYVTNEEIDAAIDAGVERFKKLGLPVPRPRVILADQYVIWVRHGGWAGGVSYGDHTVGLCIWSRGRSYTDPGDVFKKLRPGDSFGVKYDHWRYTTRPLVIALEHEYLHCVIDDPGHTSPLWAKLGTLSKEGGNGSLHDRGTEDARGLLQP